MADNDLDGMLSTGQQRGPTEEAGVSEQATRVVDTYNDVVQMWIRQKFPSGLRCPLCGSIKWNIAPLAEVMLRPELGKAYLGKALPVSPLTCGNCAHVVSFAAITMGTMPSGEA